MNKHTLDNLQSLYLGEVLDTADPKTRGRIQVRLLALDVPLWASVAVPSAGQDYGFSCLPKVGEIVVLAFMNSEHPIVLGSIWSGQNATPSEADPQDDHYVIKTPAGTVMEFDDADGPRLEITTPAGHSIKVTDSGGGKVEIKRGGQKIKLTGGEMKLSGTKVVLDASTIEMNASVVQVNSGISMFSGVVQSDVCITNSVVSAAYTPGAGNIW